MSKFKLFHIKLWIQFFCPVWSFINNIYYWVFHIFQLKDAIERKQVFKFRASNIDSIKSIMGSFKWKQYNLKDWTPWKITIINNKFKDNCSGATILGKFLLKSNNIKSNIYYLCNNKNVHAILKKFGHRYKEIIEK
jgi:hypothetical protein